MDGARHDLSAILADPRRIHELAPEDVAPLLVQLTSIQSLLSAHLLMAQRKERMLLSVAQAAKRLGVTTDWLYRHASELPFCRRLSRKQLRFEAAGLDAYLAARSVQ